jgi:hypothetical protein
MKAPARTTLLLVLLLSFGSADGFAQETDDESAEETTSSPTTTSSSGPTEADLRRVLAELKNEPSIQDVQRAALEFYKLSNKKIDSMKGRAGWKSIIPKVSAEARMNSIDIEVDKFDFIQFGDEQFAEDLIGGSVAEYKGVATWDLPKMIYNPETLDVYSLKRYREQLMKEVTRLFFLRRRIQIDFMLNPPADPQTFITKKLRIEEVTAMLDAMTGGIYTNYVSEDG